MLLDLSRLRAGVERLDRRLDPADFASAADDFRVSSPLSLAGEVRKDGEKVRLTGRLSGSLECACSRCLESFAVPVQVDLDLLFLPVGRAGRSRSGQPRADLEEGDALADEDLGVGYFRDDVLDLSEIAREQLYLALPMKPLCRDDCRGLCPVCGINRNREVCSCRTEWVDPRLEPLKHLRSES